MTGLLSSYDPSIYDEFRERSPDLYDDHVSGRGERLYRQNESALLNLIRRTLRPRTNLRVDQIVDQYRFITSKSSATPGKYEVAYQEVARGPQAAVTEKGVKIITGIGPTQLFKSSVIENVAFYYALVAPRPMILVQPNFRDATDFMSQKVQPMFAASPIMKKRVYKMNKMDLLFTGGHLTLAAATSEDSLASRLAGVMLFDEFAKYDPLRGRHPVELGDKRLETYGPFGLSIRMTSPTSEENFAWDQYFNHSDRREPFVVCPSCGHDHVMRWEKTEDEIKRYIVRHGRSPESKFNVRWKTDPNTNDWILKSAKYHCPECDHAFSEGERRKVIRKTKWRQTKPFTCCGEYQVPLAMGAEVDKIWRPTVDPSDGYEIVGRAICRHCGDKTVDNTHAGFNATRLYSMTKPLSDLLYEWKKACNSSGGKQGFYNDQLGLPWKDYQEIKLTADGLKARQEPADWHEGVMPERAVLITAGVDVHPDRFEIEIVAWGRGFESWSLDYITVLGKPDDPRTLAKVDDILSREFVRENGEICTIMAACVDTGGRNMEGEVYTTRSMYEFCGQRLERNIWPIKGASEQGEQIYPSWPRSPSTNNQYKIPLYLIGTTQLKTEVRNLLAVTQPGPQYAHFPEGRDDGWYIGLLSERKVKVGSVWRWRVKSDARNEPLDCRVYALAALEGLKAKHRNPIMVEQMAQRDGIPFHLTESEMERFTPEELDRIEAETARSMASNTASGRKHGPSPKSALRQRPEPAPEGVVAEPSASVARTMPNPVQSASPGQSPPMKRGSPARVPVPPWQTRR